MRVGNAQRARLISFLRVAFLVLLLLDVDGNWLAFRLDGLQLIVRQLPVHFEEFLSLLQFLKHYLSQELLQVVWFA